MTASNLAVVCCLIEPYPAETIARPPSHLCCDTGFQFTITASYLTAFDAVCGVAPSPCVPRAVVSGRADKKSEQARDHDSRKSGRPFSAGAASWFDVLLVEVSFPYWKIHLSAPRRLWTGFETLRCELDHQPQISSRLGISQTAPTLPRILLRSSRLQAKLDCLASLVMTLSRKIGPGQQQPEETHARRFIISTTPARSASCGCWRNWARPHEMKRYQRNAGDPAGAAGARKYPSARQVACHHRRRHDDRRSPAPSSITSSAATATAR